MNRAEEGIIRVGDRNKKGKGAIAKRSGRRGKAEELQEQVMEIKWTFNGPSSFN